MEAELEARTVSGAQVLASVYRQLISDYTPRIMPARPPIKIYSQRDHFPLARDGFCLTYSSLAVFRAHTRTWVLSNGQAVGDSRPQDYLSDLLALEAWIDSPSQEQLTEALTVYCQDFRQSVVWGRKNGQLMFGENPFASYLQKELREIFMRSTIHLNNSYCYKAEMGEALAAAIAQRMGYTVSKPLLSTAPPEGKEESGEEETERSAQE